MNQTEYDVESHNKNEKEETDQMEYVFYLLHCRNKNSRWSRCLHTSILPQTAVHSTKKGEKNVLQLHTINAQS